MGSLSVLLICVDFLDEFSAGVPSVGAPDIQTSFTLSYGLTATILFVFPQLMSIVLEPPLFVLADRYPRKWFVCGGLAAMAVCDLIAGLAPSLWVLAIALALSGPSSGCGVNLSQATLMDANPEEREKYMTRWTFMGMLGDLGAPALFALLAAFSLSWRAAFVLMSVVLALYAACLARRPFQGRNPGEHQQEQPPLLEAVRAALRNRRLLLWLFGVWLCGLLDEIFVAFGSLYMRDHLGAGVAMRSAILGCFMVGSLVGIVITDRLLVRVKPLVLLAFAAAACAVSYVAWLWAPGPASSAGLMFLVGLFSAPLYPLAHAHAYRALPGQSGMVNALSHLFGPVSLLLPLTLGLVADHFGIVVALLLLTAQPLGLLAIALIEHARRGAA